MIRASRASVVRRRRGIRGCSPAGQGDRCPLHPGLRQRAGIAWALCHGARWSSNPRFVTGFSGSLRRTRLGCDSTWTASASWAPVLDEPHTRQLDGKLRELRFYLQGVPTRITYWIAPARRIILLTVFVKTKRKEVREVQRAREAMKRCRAEGHTANEEETDDDG